MIRQQAEESRHRSLEFVRDTAAAASLWSQAMGSRTVPPHIDVSLGRVGFTAVLEVTQAPASCRALMRRLPYRGHRSARSLEREAVWSPLKAVWPTKLTLSEEGATGNPRPGQLLLYTGVHSEPEILLAYGVRVLAQIPALYAATLS